MNAFFVRISSISRKEFMHIFRDPFTMGLTIGIPFILVIFFGFAINFDFGNIKMSVVDRDHTKASRELSKMFTSSGYFSETTPDRAFLSLVINPNFGKKIGVAEPVDVQLLMDGTDNTKASIVSGYLNKINKLAIKNNVEKIKIKTRFLFNSELNTHWFIVPGLIVIVVGIISILMTALTVAREWENGSIELLLSTSVRPIEIIFGKIFPYFLIGVIATLFICIFSRLIFNVPFNGNIFIFSLASIFFINSMLAQGLLISVVTRHQQKAMQLALIIGILPSMVMSGFIFPIENMPKIFQYISMFLPQRWFMEIIRSVMLKGSGFFDLKIPIFALFLLSFFFVFLSIKKFKRDLD